MRRLLLAALPVALCFGCLQFSESGRYLCDPNANADCTPDAGSPGGGGGGGGGEDGGDGGQVGDDGGVTDGGDDGGTIDPNLVQVHRSIRYLQPDGGFTVVPLSSTAPGNPNNPPPKFWTMNTKGELVPVKPVDRDDGLFTLEVPPGDEYVYGAYQTLRFTRMRTLNLGTDENGHPGPALVDGGTTKVTLNAEKLRPLTLADSFTLASPQTGESGVLFGSGLSQGATEISNWGAQYLSYTNLGVSAAAGDRITLLHHVPFPTPAMPSGCYALMGAAVADPVDLGTQGTVVVHGTFSAISTTERILAINEAGLDQVATLIGSGAELEALGVSVSPVAVPPKFGWVGYLGDEGSCVLQLSNFTTPPPELHVNYGTAPFRLWGMGNAFAQFSYPATVQTGVTVEGHAVWSWQMPENELFKSTLETALLPPQNVKIGNIPFGLSGPLNLPSLTPVVTWTAPPQVKVPVTGYALDVFVVLQNSTGAWETLKVSTLATAGTSVRIPAGVLVSGQRYLFLLESISQSGGVWDPVKAPLRNADHYFTASTASEVFLAP